MGLIVYYQNSRHFPQSRGFAQLIASRNGSRCLGRDQFCKIQSQTGTPVPVCIAREDRLLSPDLPSGCNVSICRQSRASIQAQTTTILTPDRHGFAGASPSLLFCATILELERRPNIPKLGSQIINAWRPEADPWRFLP
jgi:hypothetical protein